MTRRICDGVNVLELGSGSIAGSLAGMLLADNGARVVKVEPLGGDRHRRDSPSGFLVWNRGKESRCLDLRTDTARSEVRSLAGHADVLIDALGLGVADGMGLGYSELASRNARLVYCSITGYGPTGEYATLPADDASVSAKAGHYALGPFGFRSGPIYSDAPMASTGAGHQAVGGILAALTAREHTGRGQLVEATLLQGLVPFDYYGTMLWQQAARPTEGSGRDRSAGPALSTPGSRISFTLSTGDGRWVNFTHMLPHQAQALSRALGLGDTTTDPRYASQPLFATAEDAEAWEDLISEALRTKSYEAWEPLLLAEGDIAFELARTSEEGLDHRQIRHNGNRIVVADPGVGPIEEVGPVAAFTATPARIDRSAPALDEHSGPFVPSPPSEATGPTPEHPLSGVTIIELGYFYAMPYGLTMAAALGARVIKLEGLAGDPMRTAFGMPEVTSLKVMEGKESLAVDLRSDEGRAIVDALVRSADVFVDGFRPGVASRLGLGAETVMGLNERLVYLHACGYGSSGPYADRPIYAGCASALAGQVARHAGPWLDPELTRSLNVMEAQAVVLPHLRGPVDGDANAALAVFTTLLLSIYDQRRTGQGQFVSTSMIGGNALAYADDFVRYAGKPPLPVADEDGHGLRALHRLYQAADGWVFVSAPDQEDWELLADGLGRADLVGDERFRDAEARTGHDAELTRLVAEIIATRPAPDWERDLGQKGVGVVRASEVTASQVTSTDRALREAGLTLEIDDATFGPVVRAAPALRFSQTTSRVAPSCLTGQHTATILHELGYDDDRIAALEADGVVATRSGPRARV